MDRQEYEDAARAAGYEIEFSDGLIFRNMPLEDEVWQPVDRHGDAFRLMVDAGVCIFMDVSSVNALALMRRMVDIEYNGDKLKATMQAIFEAAVQKGKQMRESDDG